MADHKFERFDDDEITSQHLADASKLFSEHYGIWGPKGPQLGARVRLSPRKIREQCLPAGGRNSYIKLTVGDDEEAGGHALVCRWDCDGRIVCWVTQLVVREGYRERGLATSILQLIKEEVDADMYGVLSSHPAACLAALNAFGDGLESLDYSFIAQNGEEAMETSPVPYVRDAQSCCSIFMSCKDGLISGADTSFFVDHTEPNRALDRFRARYGYGFPLGKLLEGCEFLVLIDGKRSGGGRRASDGGT